MKLNAFQRASYRLLGGWSRRSHRALEHLRLSLQKSHIAIRPEVYLSYSYLNLLIGLLGAFAISLMILGAQAAGLVSLPTGALVVMLVLPFLMGLGLYLFIFLLPDLRASTRARGINARLPYAVNYLSTMATAGVPFDRALTNLSKQPVYGEVSNEVAWVVRDMQLLGSDLVTALSTAIERSPSERFQDFLQGCVITLTSGAELRSYLANKADQYTQNNRLDQKKFLDSLGVLAESFVTVVVCAPLLLIVLLSVLTMFGASTSTMLRLGYILIFLLLPVAQFGFGLTIRSTTPES